VKREEIDQLFLEKKRKGLSNKQLAESIGCSESLLSLFFNHKCNLSKEKEIKLKKIINQAKEYRWMKIEID